MEDIYINRVIYCVKKLLKDDKYLFDCKICERSLMMRLWYYLQNEFSNYFVDCEFNKMWNWDNMEQPKEMPNEDWVMKKIYADIIIHKREPTNGNLICIEIKRNSYSKSDVHRLKKMTQQQGFAVEWTYYKFAYKYGFFVSFCDKLKKPKVKIITIVDGCIIDANEIYFNFDSLEEKAEEMI